LDTGKNATAIYPARISTMFETTDVINVSVMTTVKNFQISAQGFFKHTKCNF